MGQLSNITLQPEIAIALRVDVSAVAEMSVAEFVLRCWRAGFELDISEGVPGETGVVIRLDEDAV